MSTPTDSSGSSGGVGCPTCGTIDPEALALTLDAGEARQLTRVLAQGRCPICCTPVTEELCRTSGVWSKGFMGSTTPDGSGSG